MRKLNVAFLAILLTAGQALSVATYFLHGFQVRRQASALLGRAGRAEQAGRMDEAAEAIGQYLNLRRSDAEAWRRYARVMDSLDREGRATDRVFLVHEQAIRFNPGDLDLERRAAELALGLGRFGDAERHYRRLLGSVGEAGPARAELHERLGQCAAGVAKFGEAEAAFRRAIEDDPARVSAHARLARLLATESRDVEAGAAAIRAMVEKNPQSARALVARWLFLSEFRPPADPADVERALALAPDDPEVLLPAALEAERKGDLAAARDRWSRGLDADPKAAAFAIGMARVELREGHADRAEEVLRAAHRRNPTPELAVLLADVLISRDKIEGQENASGLIAGLRERGLGDTYARYLDAQVLLRRKQWGPALAEVRRARVLLKDDPAMIERLDLMLAECHRQLGQEEEAVKALQQAADGGASSDAAHLGLAQAMARAGKVDQALALVRPISERRPELRADVARLTIRRTLLQPPARRDWRPAEQALEALERGGGAGEASTLLRADLRAAQGKLDEAASTLEAALAREPRGLRYRLALARLDDRRGRPAEATRRVDEAERELGPGPEIELARLDLLEGSGKADAEPALAAAAARIGRLGEADRPEPLAQLAAVALRLGQPDVARRHFRELAALRPDDATARLALLDLAFQRGDDADATSLIDRLREIEGDGGTFWRYGRAVMLIAQARRGEGAAAARRATDEAEALAREVGRLRPDWWGGAVLEAQLAEARDRPLEAIRHYQQAVERGNVQPNLVQRLVGLLYRTQQFDEIDALSQALADRGVVRGELTIVTALNALRRGDGDRGLALAREVLSADSANPAELLFLGRMLLFAGRLGEAEKPLRRAVELAPRAAEAWVTYFQYLRQAGKSDEFAQGLAKLARSLPPEEVPLTLAACRALAGDDAGAEEQFAAALAHRPAHPATLRQAGEFYLRVVKLEPARAVVARLLDPKTGAPEADLAWARRARGFLELSAEGLGRFDQALALIEQNLKADPYSFRDQTARAILLAMRGSRRAEAVRALEELDRNRILGPDEQFTLAMLYGAERDWAKGRAVLLRLLERSREPRHLAYLVSLLIEAGDLDGAERRLVELKALLPGGPPPLDLEARLLKARRRDDELVALLRAHARSGPGRAPEAAALLEQHGFAREAEEEYRRYVREGEAEPIRVLLLVDFLARRGRAGEALDLCEGAWAACPPADVARVAGAAASAAGATDEQRARLERRIRAALEPKPDDPALLIGLASLQLAQRRYEESEATYRRVLDLDPKNAEALNNLAWQLALRSGRLPEALALVNRAIDAAGEVAGLLDTRAVVRLRMGEAEPALKDLGEALTGSPGNPILYFHVAMAHRLVKDEAEARKAFAEASKLGLTSEAVDPLEREVYRQCQAELERPR